MHGTIQNLTAFRLSEAKLREGVKTVLDGIPDALAVIDPDLRIAWGNRAAAWGKEPDAMAGELCFAHWHGRSEPCPDCPTRRTFATGEPQEQVIRLEDGRSFGVKTFPLREEEGGAVAQVIALAVDITEKLRLREEAIHSSRLASLGVLAAGVAHEINNPNALILLNAPLVRESLRKMMEFIDARFGEEEVDLGHIPYRRLRAELPRLLDDMAEAGGRIRRIVEDLKDFARSEGDGEREEADVNAAAGAALRLLERFVRGATDRLAVDFGENLPRVRGQVQRLEQVVVNLVMNACQALPDRSRQVWLRTRFDPPAGAVVLTVGDEGRGIPPETLPRIREPFFTTRGAQGGTGLGLSICDGIVKEFGGTLRFDSKPGEGTVATVTLPALQREER